MPVIADLHIHSRFSRACSSQLTIPNLEKYARMKGINLLGTGDFTHPMWFKEIRQLLKEDGTGLLRTESGFPFILSTEVANIFTQGGKGRRVHNVILAPDIETAERITAAFLKKGRVDYDGRPMFGFSCEELVRMMYEISEEIEVIPAHIWTPWFGVFGSESGFNSLRDAFIDEEDKIHAIETGMSSDPAMNWKIYELNNRSIVSFSDAHSFWPWRLGREATIFKKAEFYKDVLDAIRRGSIEGTIETDPAYGKYHWDGHRLCGFSSSPEETGKIRGICPVCRKGLTIGVENRVGKLTDQSPDKNPNRKHYYKMLPLHEIISAVKGVPVASKKIWGIYNPLIEKFGSEFYILMHAEKYELESMLDSRLAELILENREGRIPVKPGYDGVYGSAVIGGVEVSMGEEPPKPELNKESKSGQKGLMDFKRLQV